MPEPPPCPAREDVLPKVVQDLMDRAEADKRKYGTPPQTHDGRDALWDAYQEALDLVMYLRQALMERDE